jgi:hypothetical protein
MRMKRFVLGLGLGAWMIVGAGQAREAARCPSGQVQVLAPGPSAQRIACEAAADARRFLRACGIESAEVVRIRVREGLPEEPGLKAIGLFDPARIIAEVPTFRSAFDAMAGEGWFDHPITMPLYQSLIAHETAHAIIDQIGGPPISPMAHEYVAYAVQFGTMAPALRQAILARSSHEVPIERVELTGMYLALAPAEFGIKAHLHFTMPGHGCGFLKGVAEGEEHLLTGLE